MSADRSTSPGRLGSSRRQFLLGGAAVGLGAAAAVGADLILTHAGRPTEASLNGAVTVPFHGPHQAGVTVAPQAHVTVVALDLLDGIDRDGLRRLMRLITDDAARMTAGQPALADMEPELAVVPARLTVTVGVGPAFVARAGGSAPSWLRPLPPFSIDRLESRWSEGDLLLQVAADDPMTVAHTTRMLLKDSRSFARVRWTQTGFRRAHGSEPAGVTMRNLFGQVDGTVNPPPETEDFDSVVWVRDGWLSGGTSLVIRRISMDLDRWDRLDRSGREQSVGRTLDTGAPLTGTAETDEPDFAATTAIGFPVIPEFSHLRRARSDDRRERIVRRGWNYDEGPTAESVSDSGLIFQSYQADVDAQYVPLQRRLDELDLLNEWTTPVGSAVFAILPGCAPGGYLGDTLLG